MFKLSLCSAIVFSALIATGCSGGSGSPDSTGPNNDRTGNSLPEFPPLKTDQVIVAHRGASGHAPEHTIMAYDLALAMGAEYIEQDVLPTADGVLVCIHDDTLDRTARGPAADCTGNVSDKTLAQLQNCDFGSWFNERHPDRARPEYVGLKIPTMEQVFQRYGKDAKYYIEIKPNTSVGTSVESELLRLINEYDLRDGAIAERQVLIQSFVPSSLRTVQALDAELPLVQLYVAGASAGLAEAATYAFGIGPNITELTTNPDLLSQAHTLGLAVHPYTINNSEELAATAALCVDGQFTNFPDRYRDVLTATDYECPAPIR